MVRRRMKMAAVSAVTVLLLCCCFASADSTDSCSNYAITSEDFTVPLNHKLQATERLKWRHGEDVIYDSRSTKDKGRKDIFPNGSMILRNVNKSSTGEYIPEVFGSNGRLVGGLQQIHLCVFDRVPKPKVTLTCPQALVLFSCSVALKDKDLQFAWFKNGKLLQKEKESTLRLEAEKVETDSFLCEVSNKASSSRSEPVKQSCFSSGFTLPEELWGINIWIIVGGGAGVAVLLILIVIICCIHNRRRKRVQLKDEEELRLGWTNPNHQQQQQHHHHQHNHPPNQHHHHHHQQQQQQQPAGHTGPRQHRKKQQHNPRPRAPEPNGQPEPSPRRQGLSLPKPPESADDEQPPPLPQPRKKAPKTQRV